MYTCTSAQIIRCLLGRKILKKCLCIYYTMHYTVKCVTPMRTHDWIHVEKKLVAFPSNVRILLELNKLSF